MSKRARRRSIPEAGKDNSIWKKGIFKWVQWPQPGQFFDYQTVFYMAFLLAFGMVMLYSASSYTASLRYGNAAHWVLRQLFFAGLGIVGMILFSLVDYHLWIKNASIIYSLSILLCIYVLIAGHSSHGQARWIAIGGFTIQPSEIAKVAIILFFSRMFVKLGDRINEPLAGTKIMFGFLALPVGLVAKSNLSTAVIIFGIWFVMLMVASRNVKDFAAIMLMMLVGLALFITFASYRSDRVKIWQHPERYEKGYQTLQGLYAIGSGGIFGKGLGEGMQKKFVPEAQNDMIFSLICEELGIFGAVILIILFILLLSRLLFIARHAADMQGSYIAIGAMAQIAIQVFLNIAVVTNTIPNTGITLPFISYGGSALIILMCEIGIVLNVSRGINFYA